MRKQELHPRTAAINRTQKIQSKQSRIDAISWLAKKFPEAFDNSNMIRPLKCGIMQDILQYADEAKKEGISKSKLRQAVVVFTRRIDYLTCLKAREPRVCLLGQPVETVSDEDVARASLKIKKRVEKGIKNARKAATIAPRPVLRNSSKPFNMNNPVNSELPAAATYYTSSDKSDVSGFTPPSHAAKSAAVMVKHKSSRQFDPDVVARLKAKLGLQSSSPEKVES